MAEPKNYIPTWNLSFLYIIAISWSFFLFKNKDTLYTSDFKMAEGLRTFKHRGGRKVQGEEGGQKLWRLRFSYFTQPVLPLFICAMVHGLLLSHQSSHWAVAPLGHAGQAAGAQPGLHPLSKTGGGDGERGRGGWREVEQLQNGHSDTAAACEHARRCHPFVAAWIVLLDGVQAGAAIVSTHSIEPAVHGHQVMSTPEDLQYSLRTMNSARHSDASGAVFCFKLPWGVNECTNVCSWCSVIHTSHSALDIK